MFIHIIGHNIVFAMTGCDDCNKFENNISVTCWVLHWCCSNVIDVAALGPHNMEQHEYMERMKLYTLKLQAVAGMGLGGRWLQSRRSPCLLVDIPVPDKVLASTPVSTSDLLLVSVISTYTFLMYTLLQKLTILAICYIR